ncbi:Subtilisin-like protease SDD1 [Acorus calamus]|uniref:Subtilisin-like protease SDD1 n=1 Tax=Acorus calamus TaxID=4465 RepID=A0AAV9FNU2_ACOCL|nr:Subtilisin-like protease SDD1 [Acorus calamus]
MLYSYETVVSGFAARLIEKELKAMESKSGFLHAHPDRLVSLQTTHTPNFLGLDSNSGPWKASQFGRGVIICVLDTGITPGHPSFGDQGMPAPPTKWKGRCDFSSSNCNNKLIGARTFVSGSKSMKGDAAAAAAAAADISPADDDGHGTHTSSTAAGCLVTGANVCDGDDCADSDILAAMDAAVLDGVDVLSLSLGSPSAPFYADAIAIGAFAAVEKGVFVSCAAGNSGPNASTLSNEALWILTVGAGEMDRTVRSTVVMGDGGDSVFGESLYRPRNYVPVQWPLVYPGANGDPNAVLCGNLTGIDVRGKAVLCERGGGIARIAKGEAVREAGGAAMILMNQKIDGYSTLADAHVLPASHISFADGSLVKAYINSSTAPTAAINFEGTLLGIPPAPVITSFSSRGPSLASPGILKPDIICPGVNVLAAWPFQSALRTPRGIAALLKSSHPDWSPAAVKSAMMTSATIVDTKGGLIKDETGGTADFFAVGSGQVDPSKADAPGLVYDMGTGDYVAYLCNALGYTEAQVRAIAGRPVGCSGYAKVTELDLNYPSFTVDMRQGGLVETKRTVTNVGEAKSSCGLVVVAPFGVKVTVEPRKLEFSSVGETKSFGVRFASANATILRGVRFSGGGGVLAVGVREGCDG